MEGQDRIRQDKTREVTHPHPNNTKQGLFTKRALTKKRQDTKRTQDGRDETKNCQKMSVRKITAAEEIKVYIFVYLHRNVICMVSTATHRIRGIRLMLIVMLLVRNPSHLIPYLPVIFFNFIPFMDL